MEIISLTGKSGTGKSYQAVRLAQQLRAEAIIDDGLLIYRQSVVAGASAKKCESKAKAMRTTLFDYEEQRRDVQDKLRELQPERLLVLGTSDRMADWITDALELPRASRRVYIENITSQKERRIAARSRHVDGEHVIPAPMGELTRDFAGYFMHPQRLFRGRGIEGGIPAEDRTVVRPSYSYYGRFTISEGVIEDIVRIAADAHRAQLRVMDCYHDGKASSLGIEIDVRIRKRPDVPEACRMLQTEVAHAIETMTAFSVRCVNIRVCEMVLEREIEQKRRSRHRLRSLLERRR